MFDLAFGFVTETSENIFLTGKAGTGKTTFLKYLKDNCAKNIVVAAPTGVAAINAGGVTLHSLFQLPFYPYLPTKNHKEDMLGKLKFTRQRQQLLRKMELLVIDEISMVRADVMDAIDTILRSVRRNHSAPFGGVQLLCIGDLYQLPPVAQNHEWNILQEYYSSPFFFDSMVIKEQMPLLIELNKIYRQKEDSFVRLLNKVRNNSMDADDFEDLHMRYDPGFRPSSHENFITLTSHNKQSDLINSTELERLFTGTFTYTAAVEGDFPENLFPVEASLILKEGAQVMFLKNDTIQKRYFNGKIGVVKSLETDSIVVACDGFDITVSKETWENTRYTLNRNDGKLEQESLGTFTQFPLRLAWAITIHKSQGLTFEKVMIDAGAAFSSGQVYVALSRCTSLDGIVLLSKISQGSIYSNEHVIKGQQALTHRGSLAERFAGARQAFTQQLLEEIFSFKDIHTAVSRLLYALKENNEKFNKDGIDWALAFNQQFQSDKTVGIKFQGHIASMMKEEGVIEKNAPLQKRISDAAIHFEKRLEDLLLQVKNQPLITEHKEAAERVNEPLLETALAIYTAHYFIQYCKQPFEVSSFLRHKLNFVLPRFTISSYASGKKQTVTDTSNGELFDTLKRWRDMACEETGLPIYMIANQQTLKELSTFLPLNKKDLMKIAGFGKAKVDKYGDEILEAIEGYCTRHNLAGNIDAKPLDPKKEAKEKKSREPKEDTKTVTFRLFKEGRLIEEIAKERNLALSTIENHLTYFIETGKIPVEDIIDGAIINQIKKMMEQNEGVSVQRLKDLLPPAINYGEIRMMMAAEKFAIDQA
jgi:PIF1-like helicase/Helix-turn-helix domain/HRDC domain/Helicase